MRKLLKYKLTELGTIPNFIENGGYFPDGEYLYGISVSIDDEWAPVGTTWVSKAELTSIITAANTKLPEGMEPMTITVFEGDKFMFRYRETTPDSRLTAVEDLLAQLVEATT